jgi:predicted TIM-barrel fold metal-dependent hydrolase
VEAAYSGPDPVEETIWLESVGKAYGYPTAIVVMCDIGQIGAETELLRHLEASPRVRGVRIRSHPNDTGTAAFRAGYEALGRAGIS